jgi:DNA repair exonuclease SbcCD ATPase subunit
MKQSESSKDGLLSQKSAPGSHGSSSHTVLPNRAPDDPVTKEDVTQTVDAARQQLAELQRKKEELEREKTELEELRRKQDEYELGRKEMLERLNRSLVLLEHDQIETQRKGENIQNALVSFKARKEEIEAIREDQWNNATLKAELTRALAIVDSARNDFNHYRARLDVLDEKRNPDAAIATGSLSAFAPREDVLSRLKFGDLIKVGFALSLPLIVVGVILLIVLATRN